MQQGGIMPSTQTLNALLNVCAHARPGADVERAWGFLRTLRRMGVTPNQVTWFTLINVCANARTEASADGVDGTGAHPAATGRGADAAGAQEAFDSLLEQYSFVASSSGLNALLRAHAYGGDARVAWTRSVAAVARARAAGTRPTTHTAAALIRVGHRCGIAASEVERLLADVGQWAGRGVGLQDPTVVRVATKHYGEEMAARLRQLHLSLPSFPQPRRREASGGANSGRVRGRGSGRRASQAGKPARGGPRGAARQPMRTAIDGEDHTRSTR